jgi:hypothetical protein
MGNDYQESRWIASDPVEMDYQAVKHPDPYDLVRFNRTV